MAKKSFTNNPIATDPIRQFITPAAAQTAAPAEEPVKVHPHVDLTPLRRESRSKRIQLLITETQYTQMLRLASDNGLSVNELINRAIDKMLLSTE